MKKSNPIINFWPSFVDVFAALLIIIVIYFIFTNIQLKKKADILGEYEKDRDALVVRIKSEIDKGNSLNDIVVVDDEKKLIRLQSDNLGFRVDTNIFRNQENEKKLKELAKVYEKFLNEVGKRKYSILIVGHTDDKTGGETHNYKLSQERAQAVRDIFKEILPEKDFKIMSTGVGQYHLVYPDNSLANRTIEILLIPENLIFSRTKGF
ncbi:MAG TPA: OmpA family protein [Candidatus Cloacimonadota bacterium]|nr:OmpA family protein [Candidatus Cloacimonadota bacterium]HPK39974.1 OmpA family protein [Candidatus Cloacimonadota bacterium]